MIFSDSITVHRIPFKKNFVFQHCCFDPLTFPSLTQANIFIRPVIEYFKAKNINFYSIVIHFKLELDFSLIHFLTKIHFLLFQLFEYIFIHFEKTDRLFLRKIIVFFR